MIQSVLHHAYFNILFFCFICLIKQQAIMLFSFFSGCPLFTSAEKIWSKWVSAEKYSVKLQIWQKRSGNWSSSGTSIRELYIWYDQCRRDKRYNTCWGTSRKPYIGATLWYYMFLIDDMLHSLASIGASIFLVIAIVFHL